ncbi:hypothetical protein AAG906_029449 [Vitis piasezkii]
MKSLSFHFCVLIIFGSLLIPAICHGHDSHSQKPHKHVPLFVFGDSLFDPGNNLYLNTRHKEASAYWPYGETFFKRPTGRLSDGRLVPDFIAEFMELPLTTAYLQPGTHRFTHGSNFASGGAGVLADTHPGTISLPLQLSYFKTVVKQLKQKLGEVKTKKLLMRAVYLFSIGGNDYFGFYMKNQNASQSSQTQFVGMVIRNLTNALEEIYQIGGRKIAFQNVGPLGCVPTNRAKTGNGACAEEASAMAKMHNAALANVLKNLQTRLPRFKYSIFDYYNTLSDKINHPSKYGFKEGKSACCGSGAYRANNCGGQGVGGTTTKFELCSIPGDYVWFDGGHTTERANRQLAELLWNGTPNCTAPHNIKQLFGHME